MAQDATSRALPYLERAKIQAEILMPLYRRLKTEVGAARAREMLKEAVDEFAHGFGREIARGPGTNSLDKLRNAVPMFTAGDALDVETLEQSHTHMSFNVRRCKYAEFFHELGEPELGRLMVCGIDPPMTAAIGPDLKLERTQTLMEGADHCDFRWSTTANKS